MAGLNSQQTDLTNRLPAALSDDYELIRKLDNNNGTSVVFQVISTRGRLRGRPLIAKKVIRSDATTCSYSLHQTLYHPNIIALHSIISLDSDTFNYHIIELCAEGSLLNLIKLRSPLFLTDIELRSVVKGVTSALIYLKGERIIHRDVGLPHILLAQGFQPKLCAFRHASRLDLGQQAISLSCHFAMHPAPETLKNPCQYDFSIDAWALGCVLYCCIGGSIDGTGADAKFVNAMFSNYPAELQDLISALLTTSPPDRLQVEDLLQHAYLADSSKIMSKSRLSSLQDKSSVYTKASTDHKLLCATKSLITQGIRRESSGNVDQPSYTTSDSVTSLRRRTAFKDIGNVALPRFLRPDSTSAPGSGAPSHCTTRNTIENSAEDSTLPRPNHKCETSGGSAHTFMMQSRKPNINKIGRDHQASAPISTQPILPIGTTRPFPIDTSLLIPRMHKLAAGTITILASQSLLIDFRQSQRRQGLTGDQVMIITNKGASIKIFDAPHLSAPCCLVEPVRQYSLDILPSKYWKQYNDTAIFVNRLKRKIPHITKYDSRAKCTLMSNFPFADIEILLYGESPSTTPSKDQAPTMRVHYSRQRHFLEVSQRFAGDRGTEWKKECKPCLGPSDISTLFLGDETNSDALLQNGLKLLVEFLKTCQYVERSQSAHLDLEALETTVPVNKPSALTYSLTSVQNPVTSSSGNALSILEGIRYLPSVGWCQRYFLPDAPHDPRYVLMFLNGVSLVVDTSRKSIVFSPPNGDPITCATCLANPGSCHPAVERYSHTVSDFISLYVTDVDR